MSISRWRVVVLAVSVLCSPPIARSEDDDKAWPKTVTEAVKILKGRMSAADLAWLRSNPKEHVVASLHLPYGTGVRNEFGLWGKNKALLNSCGTEGPEECSGVIFSELWDTVRKDLDPAMARALDCQFAAVGKVMVNPAGFYKTRIGKVMENIQAQINKQIRDRKVLGCALDLKLVVRGGVNSDCWTRYEFEKRETLEDILNWMSWRNGFQVLHEPPNLVLDFHNPCTWPEKPEWFRPGALRVLPGSTLGLT